MRKNLALTAATVALLLVVAMTGRAQSVDAKIAVEPAEVRDVESGGTFTVNITITDASNLYGWQINVTFKPDVLSAMQAVEGSFMKSFFNDTVWPSPSINNDRGYVLASASIMPPYPSQGASGGGVLASITFSVKSGGTTDLHFDESRTYLRTVTGGVPVPIENLVTQDGVFRGTGGGFGLPLEYVAGAVVIIVVIAGAGLIIVRRRRQ